MLKSVSGGGAGSAPRGWVSGPGGVCLARGGISQHALRQTPLPPPVDRHTPVKILPWPNFVAAGNNLHVLDRSYCVLLQQKICFSINNSLDGSSLEISRSERIPHAGSYWLL